MSNEWKMVPVNPTEEMLVVLHRDILISVNARKQSASILNDKSWWAKVVGAAPEHDAQTELSALRQQLADVSNERDEAVSRRDMIHKQLSAWQGLASERLDMLKASEARNAEALELLEPLAAYAADSANAVMRARAVSARKLVAHQSAPATDGEGVSRVITLSGCKFTEHELIERAVRAATGTARRGTQRWIAMKDAFGCGSGVANALCHRFDFDPDEMVKP